MKSFKFPNPFTVLIIIISLSALATILMPAGRYATLSYDGGQDKFILNMVRKAIHSRQNSPLWTALT